MYGDGKPQDYSKGKAAEALGLKMLKAYFGNGQATASGSIEDRRGTDVYVQVSGQKTSVDIKALKKHAPDQILLEHRNVSGGTGWSHRSGLALIFVSATDAILVNKRYLSLLLNDPRKTDWSVTPTQQPREYVENYKPYGRPENQEAVIYVPYSQVMRLLTSKRLRWNPATQTVSEVK